MICYLSITFILYNILFYCRDDKSFARAVDIVDKIWHNIGSVTESEPAI